MVSLAKQAVKDAAAACAPRKKSHQHASTAQADPAAVTVQHETRLQRLEGMIDTHGMAAFEKASVAAFESSRPLARSSEARFVAAGG